MVCGVETGYAVRGDLFPPSFLLAAGYSRPAEWKRGVLHLLSAGSSSLTPAEWNG